MMYHHYDDANTPTIQEINAYLASLFRELDDAHWGNDDLEVQHLHKRINSVTKDRDRGEPYFIPF